MLSNFQMKGRPLLQSFLLGQREFRNTMRSEGFEQLRQRVIAAYHLKPLDADETRGYVEHRLQLVGWRNDPTFTEDVFDGIYEYTDGVPRRINTLCDRLLLFGYLEELHELDMEALSSVAHDIIEEQMGPSPHEDDGLPSLESLVGGQSGDALPSPPRESSRPKTRIEADPESSQRLAAMEQSMSDLTNAVRQELSLLREALLQKKEKNGE